MWMAARLEQSGTYCEKERVEEKATKGENRFRLRTVGTSWHRREIEEVGVEVRYL